MPKATYTRAEYEYLKKQKSFAWAKYFQSKREAVELARIIIQQTNLLRVDGQLQRPSQLPPHITNEFMDMAEQLNKEYTCPICLELTTKDTIDITWCGHILCKVCCEQLKRTEPKCPMCRKSL